jgi:hypothetical protein
MKSFVLANLKTKKVSTKPCAKSDCNNLAANGGKFCSKQCANDSGRSPNVVGSTAGGK